MTAQPVRRQKLTASVTEELLAFIQRSRLKTGERLPGERQLAEQMGVSRASVRDGIARLEVLGHVEVRHGDGLYVREPSAANLTQPFVGILSRTPQNVLDLLEFRLMLEPEVAAAAAMRGTPDQIRELQHCLEQQQETAAQHIKLTSEDIQFHRLIAQMAGNAVVVQVMDTLQHLFFQLRDQVLVGNQPSRTIQEHGAIVQAISDHSPDAAKAAMSHHLSTVREHALTAIGSTSVPEGEKSDA